MKILSISIAAYNAEKWLERCVRSLVDTSVADELDIIIVNDGSKDSTLKISKSLQIKYPNIINVIDKENGGHGSTINSSIKVAKGKYFKIVDSDDWVEKDGMELLVRDLNKSNADIVMNPYFVVDADTMDKSIVSNMFNHFPYDREEKIKNLRITVPLVMHTICFKTETLKRKWKNLDEHCFYVDAEYTLYNFSKCETILFLKYPVYDYLLGTEEQSMNFKNMVKRRNQHERVCFSSINFYMENQESYKTNKIKKKTVEKRIFDLLETQYLIFMCLPYGESKRELRSFDKKFNRESSYLYNKFFKDSFYGGLNLIKTVKKARKNNYKCYLFYNFAYRKKYL